ncbi:hypothetical protein FCE95_13170 [Luteimonas gilva]|uniref:Uncharacterized protein n=1 Tax=Luteimonas gilva TaxID=2572684 RepID=A0A4U5JRB0_9GAMM|nr:hypothetical protein [Luteimonas gilva]TKR31028.1 hypothetical protein FCE95_13170 [Luteimonas gilva]
MGAASTQEVIAEIQVEFALLPSLGQRRGTYRPNHKHPHTGDFFLGQVAFQNGHVDAGSVARAVARVLLRAEDLDSLIRAGAWEVWEGSTLVGHIEIIGPAAVDSIQGDAVS